jgi:allophanate hydrolase subunit 2
MGPKQQNLEKTLLGGYPKEPEFQNSEDTKLAQMRPGAKISAF